MEAYIPRSIEAYVMDCSAHFGAVAVVGPRQVGKTTMLRHLAALEADRTGVERSYVSLDDGEERRLAQEDPRLFLQLHQPPLLIDEAQYAPQLFPYLKMYLDDHEECGTIWLTGSQPLHLRKAFQESLAGRIAIISMLGFSQSELNGVESVPFTCDSAYYIDRSRMQPFVRAPELYHRIWKGSLPRICLGDDRFWQQSYASYVDTYLMRDIAETHTIRDESKFRRFLGACAAMTGQPLNYSLLATTADIDVKTASAWFSLLESSYVVQHVEAFSSNFISRLTKSPTIQFFDTGLACYLSRWTTSDSLAEGALNGHILETYSYLEMQKSWSGAYVRPDVSFLRTERGKEIDFVVTSNGVPHPVEVKRTASPGINDIKNFTVLDKVAPTTQGCVLCLCEKPMPITERFWSFPIWAI